MIPFKVSRVIHGLSLLSYSFFYSVLGSTRIPIHIIQWFRIIIDPKMWKHKNYLECFKMSSHSILLFWSTYVKIFIFNLHLHWFDRKLFLSNDESNENLIFGDRKHHSSEKCYDIIIGLLKELCTLIYVNIDIWTKHRDIRTSYPKFLLSFLQLPYRVPICISVVFTYYM